MAHALATLPPPPPGNCLWFEPFTACIAAAIDDVFQVAAPPASLKHKLDINEAESLRVASQWAPL